MDIPPDVQKQLDEQKKQCVFCKIVGGEIAGKKVFDDDLTMAVLDINPAVKGHTLVMPKEHYPILPYIPRNVFLHVFGVLPNIVKAIKESLIVFGVNIFIANGGVAGQQSPHFLFHIFPRESGDGLEKFDFGPGKNLDSDKVSEGVKALSYAVPLLMRKFFSQNHESWHSGSGSTPEFLSVIRDSSDIVYEDERVLCVTPKNPFCAGHLILYSKVVEKLFENLDSDNSSHLFQVASIAASACFEGLQAHGTNIVLKSGKCPDNPSELLSVHIIPRWQDDGINLSWNPNKGLNDGDVSSIIRDKTFFIGTRENVSVAPATPHRSTENVVKVSVTQKPDIEQIDDAVKRVRM
ncbi:HIT domain-containing protein [Candidatus Woesearchaeota archaeon]|nr:HIT domain-containing protein [Candidatus Woesearchaeota archaeon]